MVLLLARLRTCFPRVSMPGVPRLQLVERKGGKDGEDWTDEPPVTECSREPRAAVTRHAVVPAGRSIGSHLRVLHRDIMHGSSFRLLRSLLTLTAERARASDD